MRLEQAARKTSGRQGEPGRPQDIDPAAKPEPLGPRAQPLYLRDQVEESAPAFTDVELDAFVVLAPRPAGWSARCRP